MDTILNRIIAHKRTEVERQRIKIPYEQMRARAEAAPPPRDFGAALRARRPIALIAEVKKASPSKGVLIENFDPPALARLYASNGAAAISVLTDIRFFQGHLKYMEGIRALFDRGAAPPLPLLRKDFIIDPYQVVEARAYGADAVLLIVAALDDATLATLLALTGDLGMQALVEVHNETNSHGRGLGRWLDYWRQQSRSAQFTDDAGDDPAGLQASAEQKHPAARQQKRKFTAGNSEMVMTSGHPDLRRRRGARWRGAGHCARYCCQSA
ncbi:MAG: indole-3-glycerol phosphate synthase TrpC [Roseiflexaceae bacterium]|nr:indole-3-glycerol phosphate synthase TrpC [Roseiflexaceae bacterium]